MPWDRLTLEFFSKSVKPSQELPKQNINRRFNLWPSQSGCVGCLGCWLHSQEIIAGSLSNTDSKWVVHNRENKQSAPNPEMYCPTHVQSETQAASTCAKHLTIPKMMQEISKSVYHVLSFILLQDYLCVFQVWLELPNVIFIPVTSPANQVLHLVSILPMCFDCWHLILLLIFNLYGWWLRW